MSLFVQPIVRALDANGNPMSGAKLYFYVTGTTTPTDTFTTSALSVAHSNPVEADSGGLFAPIYLSPATQYRAILKTSAGATVQDIDPLDTGQLSVSGTTVTVTNDLTVGDDLTVTGDTALTGPVTLAGTLAVNGNATIGDNVADTHTVNGALTITSTLAVNGNATLGDAGGDSHTINGTLTGTGAILSSSATAPIGYTTGAGGTVTQATSKSTGVTLSKTTGQITLNGAALAADTTVSFTLTNTAISATDLLILNHVSGGTAGAYTLNAQAAAGTASINVRNVTGGSLSEAIVIGFAVINGVTA